MNQKSFEEAIYVEKKINSIMFKAQPISLNKH